MYSTKEKRNAYAREWRKRNPGKAPKVNAKYRAAHPDRVRSLYREAYLKRTYGISAADFKHMLLSQDFSCAVCLRAVEDNDKMVHVDHDHVTGKVRGILCHYCNTALGKLGDNIENLQRAIRYLQKAADDS